MSAELKGLAVVSLAASAYVAASANRTGVDMLSYDGQALLVMDASATAGSGQTLDVKIQHSDTLGGTYADTGVAFTQVTSAAASYQQIAIDVDKYKRFLRVVDTAGGSLAGCARSVQLLAKRRV